MRTSCATILANAFGAFLFTFSSKRALALSSSTFLSPLPQSPVTTSTALDSTMSTSVGVLSSFLPSSNLLRDLLRTQCGLSPSCFGFGVHLEENHNSRGLRVLSLPSPIPLLSSHHSWNTVHVPESQLLSLLLPPAEML